MDHEHAITATPHAASSHAITEHPHGSAPFTAAEIDAMHMQDMAAGRAVVVLMCSIFLIGVLIYSVVVISIVA